MEASSKAEAHAVISISALEEEKTELAGESKSILTSHQELEQKLPRMLLSVGTQQQWNTLPRIFHL